MPTPFSNANWIALGEGGNFTYHVFRYQFYMDAAVTPGSFNLNLDFYTDDLMRRVFVNDELIQDYVWAIRRAMEVQVASGPATGPMWP